MADLRALVAEGERLQRAAGPNDSGSFSCDAMWQWNEWLMKHAPTFFAAARECAERQSAEAKRPTEDIYLDINRLCMAAGGDWILEAIKEDESNLDALYSVIAFMWDKRRVMHEEQFKMKRELSEAREQRAALAAALAMFYDRWEEGASNEDGPGRFVDISYEEENEVLAELERAGVQPKAGLRPLAARDKERDAALIERLMTGMREWFVARHGRAVSAVAEEFCGWLEIQRNRAREGKL